MENFFLTYVIDSDLQFVKNQDFQITYPLRWHFLGKNITLTKYTDGVDLTLSQLINYEVNSILWRVNGKLKIYNFQVARYIATFSDEYAELMGFNELNTPNCEREPYEAGGEGLNFSEDDLDLDDDQELGDRSIDLTWDDYLNKYLPPIEENMSLHSTDRLEAELTNADYLAIITIPQ